MRVKTRTDFMRDAKKGMALRPTIFWGIPREEILAKPLHELVPSMRRRVTEGVFDVFREVTKVQTNAIMLGNRSYLDIPAAARMEYVGDKIRFYTIGKTPMTKEELAIMAEWEKVTKTKEYQDQSYVDALTDGSQTFYKKKHFFMSRNFGQLLGYKYHNGRKLDTNAYFKGETNCVYDNKVRGICEFEYEVKLT